MRNAGFIEVRKRSFRPTNADVGAGALRSADIFIIERAAGASGDTLGSIRIEIDRLHSATPAALDLAGVKVIRDFFRKLHEQQVFSPSIWWIGLRMNFSGSDVQILQMYS